MAASGVLLIAFYLSLLKKRKREAHLRRQRERKVRFMRFYRLMSRRKLVFCALVLRCLQNRQKSRTVWARQRSRHWWNIIVGTVFIDKDWLENFRMKRCTFMFICDQLRPSIQKNNTRMRPAIPVEMRVGITLWKLATNADFRTVGQLFGVARNTCHSIFHETVESINAILGPRFISQPTEARYREIINGFETKFGFPQVVGAIDGTHIPIISPEDYPVDYYNRKGFHSVVLQGIVDHDYRFWNINCGYPGKNVLYC